MNDQLLEKASNVRREGSMSNRINKQKNFNMIAFALLCVSILFTAYGCSGGTSDFNATGNVSSTVVTGVVAVGDTLAGEAAIKDSLNIERKTVIAADGSFALDVAGMRAPFILRAVGSSNGVNYTLHSFAGGPGTANINPFSNALVAHAAEMDDPAVIYGNPASETLNKIKTRLPQSIVQLQSALRPLLTLYAADSDDPISGQYQANHTRLDGLFDAVRITLNNGTFTIRNAATDAMIFSGAVTALDSGNFNAGSLPQNGAAADTPAGLLATAGANQITLSWSSVGNATSYNIYWSAATGVTKANGNKIAGVTSPYLHGALTAGTAYYYVVTAVNSAGESAESVEVSAMTAAAPPTPAVPAAPTGLTATGGTRQVTVTWAAVSGATSYNIYWSTSAGVTKTNGTKITGATSPVVHTGRLDGTAYYYIVTAVNDVGESEASIQVAAATIAATPSPTAPLAPNGLTAAGGAQQATISWLPVTGATSYNLYYSTTSGVTVATGTRIAGVTSPYVQTGLSAGITYYYIVTAVNNVGESAPSIQVNATTNAPLPQVPSVPGGVTATGGSRQVTISWAPASGATSYNIYWSTLATVTVASGTRIAGATSPYIHTGRLDSTAYYYVVTALNNAGESAGSTRVTATTSAPALDGAALYAASCQRCHGPITNHDLPNGMTVQSIKNASMAFGRTDAELQAIINAMP